MSDLRIATSDEAGLIAKFRTPLDGRSAARLAATVLEHPEHVVSVEGIWLVFREEAGA